MKTLAVSTLQVLCATAVLSGSVGAQAPRARPESERRHLSVALRDTVKAVLDDGVASKAFPGAYAVIGDSRGVLAQGGAGRLDWSDSPTPKSNTLWDLASLTKILVPVTALAQLIEQGRVELDAPVQRYVPSWTGPWKDRVTIRHLMTHTSGLPSFKPYDRQTHDPDSLAALLFSTQLDRAPGDTMIYSDIGAFMMGQVVERVSGERLDVYAKRHIFEPLKMRQTMFNPPESLWKRVAPTEFDSTRGGLMHGKVHDERAYYLAGVAAHAGLFSTASDVTRFVSMMLRGGTYDGVKVLGAQTIKRITAYADSGRHNRALGWQKAPAPWAGHLVSSRAYGHTGFTGTSILIDPENNVFVILLSNRVNPTRNNQKIGEVRSRIADAVLSAVHAMHQPSTAGAP